MSGKQTAAAGKLIKSITEFTRADIRNRLPTDEHIRIFDDPLVQFAAGDDPLFTELKAVISSTHLTPAEALERATGIQIPELPAKLSVISWILPINEATIISNRVEKTLPSRAWSHAMWFGEVFNKALREHVVGYIQSLGYMACAPAIDPYFEVGQDVKGLRSNWSEQHVAYATGLGTFGLSGNLISARGSAHHCGSVVTELQLPASPRKATSPYGNCRYFVNGECGICISRCPAGAISTAGHDKVKCAEYLKKIGYDPDLAVKGYDLETSVAGCGLCQTGVPCESGIPVAESPAWASA